MNITDVMRRATGAIREVINLCNAPNLRTLWMFFNKGAAGG